MEVLIMASTAISAAMFMTYEIENLELPESFDWRDKTDCIHPVRD